jgi:hypothetical protein
VNWIAVELLSALVSVGNGLMLIVGREPPRAADREYCWGWRSSRSGFLGWSRNLATYGTQLGSST